MLPAVAQEPEHPIHFSAFKLDWTATTLGDRAGNVPGTCVLGDVSRRGRAG